MNHQHQHHHLLLPRHGGGKSGSAGKSHNGSCRESYNFKHPHPCTPGADCTFVVMWGPVVKERRGEEWVELHVTAALSDLGSSHHSVWVALGFSSDSDMVGVAWVTVATSSGTTE